jgi:hypothetical protein
LSLPVVAVVVVVVAVVVVVSTIMSDERKKRKKRNSTEVKKEISDRIEDRIKHVHVDVDAPRFTETFGDVDVGSSMSIDNKLDMAKFINNFHIEVWCPTSRCTTTIAPLQRQAQQRH